MDGAPSRRRLLATTGAAAASAMAGCADRLSLSADQSPLEQVEVTIRTLPNDADPMAARIASQFGANLRAAGIDAGHEPMDEPDLYREVLINGDYDAFVARHPGYDDPDALRGLLHSRFTNEQGWQNPFRFSDEAVDDLLESQARSEGSRRRRQVAELFETLGLAGPFTVVAFPHHIGAATTAFDLSRPPRTPIDYVEIATERADAGLEGPLRVGIVEYTLTDRLNPIAVDLGDVVSVLGLIYDPLVRAGETGPVPWLAERVTWADPEIRGSLEATVELREDAVWHDGEPVDARDVAFTVDFLADTSLGAAETPIPAPRYRGRTTLIDRVIPIDASRVRFDFGDRSREAVARALTFPLLPRHVWEPLAEPIESHTTEALAWDNEAPVGAGLYAFADSTPGESLTLEPFPDHPLYDADAPNRPGPLEAGGPEAGIEFRVTANPGTAIAAVGDGEIDVIATSLSPSALAEADGEEVSILETPTESIYVVGYNIRHPELTNPQFRRLCSRLVDRAHVVEDPEFFDGHAEEPTTVSELYGLLGEEWSPLMADLEMGFPGEDGAADPETVRDLFVEAGYRYDDDDLVA